jgi:mono/diheme cytochrome c family protein
MRYVFLIFALCTVMVMVIAGKRGSTSRRPPIELFADMDRQPKLRPQTPNSFFGDERSSRGPIPGTIARGDAYEDIPANTGRMPGTTNFVEHIPVPVTPALMARGRERFNINCSPCHGMLADGNGVVKKLGIGQVANLHDRRIVELADGEIFNTISNGKSTMSGYAANVVPQDRWAIVAYLRALQLSQLGLPDDVPDQYRNAFKK